MILTTEDIINIKTFQQLESLFIANKEKYDDADFALLMSTYTRLVSDRYIIVKGGYTELVSAKRCRDIIMSTCHKILKGLADDNDSQHKITVAFYTIPVEKLLLNKADTYEELESIFIAETKYVEGLEDFDGDLYAKQYWQILDSGLFSKSKNIKKEGDACVSCAQLISQTKLSEEWQKKMQKETIMDKLDEFTGAKNGCLSFIVILLVPFYIILFL